MFGLKGIKNNTIKNYFLIFIFMSICFQQIGISGKKIHASIRGNLKEDSLAKLLEFKNKKNFLNIIKIIVNKKNYKNNNFNFGNEINSWDNYFHNKEYEKIKKIVKNNRVMCVDIDTLVAVMNDIKVIDGYHVLYYAYYKKKFRKIISKEIDKNEFLKGYYDSWGNRGYAFYNDKDSLLINFKGGKNLGANYVVSGFNIDNEDLKLIEKIPGDLVYIHDTSWMCYLCKKSDAFYLYKII